ASPAFDPSEQSLRARALASHRGRLLLVRHPVGHLEPLVFVALVDGMLTLHVSLHLFRVRDLGAADFAFHGLFLLCCEAPARCGPGASTRKRASNRRYRPRVRSLLGRETCWNERGG